MKNKRVQILGLTGNIGSGKSTVSGYLAGRGACILDADQISRVCLLPDGACFRQVTDAFGVRILGKDGYINRKSLAQIVFNDKEARDILNGIVHPYVKETMAFMADAALREQPDRLVVLDVPLLIESGMAHMADINALVYAEDTIRLKRILERDGCTAIEALSRMQAQMSQEEKKAYCQIVLNNNGTIEQLYAQTDKLYTAVCDGTVLDGSCGAGSSMIK